MVAESDDSALHLEELGSSGTSSGDFEVLKQGLGQSFFC